MEQTDAMHQWLAHAAAEGASDLHIVAGHPPVLRLHGALRPIEAAPLSGEDTARLLGPLCPPETLTEFERTRNADFALEISRAETRQRFRANYFMSGQRMGACFRVIPEAIPDFAWAGFPEGIADRLAHLRNGLVLMSGVAGSGKTTSLAMIIQLLNREGGYRIITVEEPIEYVFPKMADSIITQREVGHDVTSFADGLKFGLRQDPDVMLVGEIRDRDTAQIALSAAETGHLVFSTLHTRDAKGAISRYADLFPQSAQTDIRAQLAMSLRAVISQHLLPSAQAGAKRELALEILFNNSPIASAIRFGKLESIDNCILTGRADGMIPLDHSIQRLYRAQQITRAIALHFVSDPSTLR